MADFPDVGFTFPEPSFETSVSKDDLGISALPPVIENPPSVAFIGSATIGEADSVVLDITSTNTGGLGLVFIRAQFSDRIEVVAEGLVMAPGYSGTVDPIGGGYRFTFSRDDGWPEASMDILCIAADVGGLGEGNRAYTIDPPPTPDAGADITPPVVSNFSPVPGTTLAKTAAVGFDVTDETGLFSRIMVTVRFPATGVEELVHDGDSFAPFYTKSSRVPIAGGLRYSVTRVGGWPSSPTFRVFPLDAAGNQP